MRVGATLLATSISAACAPLSGPDHGGIAFVQPAAPPPEPAAGATFLPGDELAVLLLRDVVLIRNLDVHDSQGVGLIVGARGGSVYVLTASHVISTSDDINRPPTEVSRHFELRHCLPPPSGSAPITDARVAFNDPTKDIGVLEFPSDPAAVPVVRALADEKPDALQVIWTIGKVGVCDIGSGQIDFVEDADGILIADLPGGYGGTSGAPIISDAGVVGMVLSNPGAAKVKMRSVADITKVLGTVSSVSWALVNANNKAPGSRGDVQLELVSSLDNYLYRLKDIRDSFMKEHFTEGDLAARVDGYNKAILGFNGVKNKFDPALEHYWGAPTLSSFADVRSAIEDIHRTILRFNASMDKVRKQQVIPPELRSSMTALSPKVDALDASSKALIAQLNARN
jgi:hypothetical protein